MSHEKYENCTPIQASAIKKGDYAILKGRPCKIIAKSVCKTGKHGHAKCSFIGIDVFTGKKIEDMCSSTHGMYQPILVKDEYDLLNIDEENYMSLMTENGEQKEDLQLLENDLGEEIRQKFESDEEVTVLKWGSEEAVISYKILKD